jgi:hypothetical protein
LIVPSQQCAHASQQLFKRKRLGQIIVGPRIKPFDSLLHGITRRQKQDRRLTILAAELPQDFDAVFAWEPPIEQYEIPVAGFKRDFSRAAIGKMLHAVSLFRKPTDYKIGDPFFILDN